MHPAVGMAESTEPGTPSSSCAASYSLLSRSSSERPHLFVRRADLGASLAAYERLLAAIKSYTTATLTMSNASSELAAALEECSAIKGAHTCGEKLQAAGGLHYLKSNYEQVLCDTFWKEISIPLLSNLDTYKATVQERQILHERTVSEKSRILKDIERKNQREGRRRERDLSSFRSMLSELQTHVDYLETLKLQHYNEVLEYEENAWEYISSKVALLVRMQADINDRIATKASSDPVLESMTSAIPDPFNTYGPPKRDGELFTILQPSSLASGAVVANEFKGDDATLRDDGSTSNHRNTEKPSGEVNSIFSESGDELEVPRTLVTSTSYASLFGQKQPKRTESPATDESEERIEYPNNDH